jgi:hypothetical protein
VYEWISARCEGLKVVDMAAGEGYGADVLSRTATQVTGVEANPDAYEHARHKYTRPGLEFVSDLVQTYDAPCDAISFLQTIEHVEDPKAVLGHMRSMLRGGVCYVSTPNVLTLAPPGKSRSDNPWHLREYTHDEFRSLCESVFDRVELFGLFHAGRLRLHDWALRMGWDRLHPRMGITQIFYDRFTAAITAEDFLLKPEAECKLDRALDFVAVLA